MSKHYFTADGTYGQADEPDFISLDASTWTAEMWEDIEGVSDSQRMWLATHFANGQHPIEIDENGTPKCKQCFLEPRHLNGGK